MVTLTLVPTYRGERLDVVLQLAGVVNTRYELYEFLKHIKAIEELLPLNIDPDQ